MTLSAGAWLEVFKSLLCCGPPSSDQPAQVFHTPKFTRIKIYLPKRHPGPLPMMFSVRNILLPARLLPTVARRTSRLPRPTYRWSTCLLVPKLSARKFSVPCVSGLTDLNERH